MDKMDDILKRWNTGQSSSAPGQLERMKAETVNSKPGDLNATDGYNCDRCKNKGYIMQAVNDGGAWRVVGQPCECIKHRRTLRRIQRSGLEKSLQSYTFDTFETTQPWQKTVKGKAVDYSEHPDGWFYLGGQSGCGKTHICTAICGALLMVEREVVYMLWRDYIIGIKAAINDGDLYRDMITPYKTAEVLYIDDLFKGGAAPTAADVNVAFEILNYRYINGLPTILSSEMLSSDLMAVDEAIAGRIVERAGDHMICLTKDKNRNYRLRPSGAN